MLHKIKKFIPQFLLTFYHLLEGIYAFYKYKHPRKIKVIGVTGTDGKTTTTEMIAALLEGEGHKVAMLNGIARKVADKREKNSTDNSTPNSFVVQKFLYEAKEAKCDYAILEVTSWGLVQHRLWGIVFKAAAFTNLTLEHLDLHKTMDRYKEAKGLLFKNLDPKNGVVSVNLDDKYSDYYLSFPVLKKYGYSILEENSKNSVSVLHANNLKLLPRYSEFELNIENTSYIIKIAFPGKYNALNALAAIGIALGEDVKPETIQKVLLSFDHVPGRFNYVNVSEDFKVIVDFAHTPNAFKSLFTTVKQMFPESRLVAIFGATGGRCEERRPLLGEVAGELIDFSILTEEDPRNESPKDIADQIIPGLKNHGKEEDKDYIFIENRKEAITYALENVEKNDVIMLLSMGEYEAMYVGDGKVKWNDEAAVRDVALQLNIK